MNYEKQYDKETNRPMYIDCIETPNGFSNTQGYRVYSTEGIGITLRVNGGGYDGGTGLYIVVERDKE